MPEPTKKKSVFDAINSHLEEYLSELGYKPNSEGLFSCGCVFPNHHPDKHPSAYIKGGRMYCFSHPCQENGRSATTQGLSLVDILCSRDGLTPGEVLKRYADRWGEPLENGKEPKQPKPKAKASKPDDFSTLFDPAYQGNQDPSAYLTSRGFISLDALKFACPMVIRSVQTRRQDQLTGEIKTETGEFIYLGYRGLDAKNRLSIRYYQRRIIKGVGDRYSAPKGVKPILFDPLLCLQDLPYEQEKKRGVVVVCEGEFDALSLLDLKAEDKDGLEPIKAIAIEGAGKMQSLAVALSSIKDKNLPYAFFVAFDGDKTGILRGEEAERLISSFGYPILRGDLRGGFKDINERLQKDREGLRTALYSLLDAEEKDLTAQPIPEEGESLGVLLSAFEKTQGKGYAGDGKTLTGFASLDKIGLPESGLIYLGGLPKRGKTTLALQLAEQIAVNAGRKVSYLTLESTPQALLNKSLARTSYLMGKPLTQSEIREAHKDKESKADLSKAIQGLRRYEHLLKIIVPGADALETIEAEINHARRNAVKPPVIVLDYLQNAVAGETDARIAVNHLSKSLQRLALTHGLLIIAISSISRGSYSDKITLSSFKESGNIEFDADMLLALDPAPKAEGEQEPKGGAKAVTLSILANRHGEEGAIPLLWLPGYAVFLEDMGGETKSRNALKRAFGYSAR